MADRNDYHGYREPSDRYAEAWEFGPEPIRGGGDRNERGRYGGGRDNDRYRMGSENSRNDWRGDNRGGRNNDRGFFEKAGEEIRSWFSDDDDRGRHRDRDRDEWRSQSRDDSRNRGYGYGSTMSGTGGRGRDFSQDASEPWGGGDRERRYGSSAYESGGSRYSGSSGSRGGRFEDRGGYGVGGTGGDDYGRNRFGSHPHDEHYSEWRRQQMNALDRDYDEYRRENRDKFHNEFSSWRTNRQQQRSSMRNVREHMDVVGSDGEHIGTVDKVAGDRIILTKSDAAAGGHHHSIPCSWIQSVDERVTINKSAQDARQHWQDEENRRALFENDDRQRDDGPHVLNRSFSGTYEDR